MIIALYLVSYLSTLFSFIKLWMVYAWKHEQNHKLCKLICMQHTFILYGYLLEYFIRYSFIHVSDLDSYISLSHFFCNLFYKLGQMSVWVCLTFNLLVMIVTPLQTAWNQTRRLVRFQAGCHSANMSSKF